MGKYGCNWGGWTFKEVTRGEFPTGTSSYGISLWKFIRRGWDSFSRVTCFYIGDATKVRFWHDIWCGLVLLV